MRTQSRFNGWVLGGAIISGVGEQQSGILIRCFQTQQFYEHSSLDQVLSHHLGVEPFCWTQEPLA